MGLKMFYCKAKYWFAFYDKVINYTLLNFQKSQGKLKGADNILLNGPLKPIIILYINIFSENLIKGEH